ncbi:MAG: hypothetical protein RIC19_20325 [Phaeodactylibacter sp.]|uniref:hypothetical protein n=1 Tax=Phaeodactylibacter sp. TaxID=1940289 RepID=UPI0032F00ED1
MSKLSRWHSVFMLLVKGVIIGGLVLWPYVTISLKQIKAVDCFYPKLTHRAEHLILGVSRAAVGIAPEVLKSELGLKERVLNFAFIGAVTPYGPDYSRLVHRKIAKGEEPPVFILSVHPDNLSKIKNRDLWRERSHPVYDLFFVNLNPNVEYILRNIRRKKATLINFKPTALSASFRFFEGGWMGLEGRRAAEFLEEEAETIIRLTNKKIPAPERLKALSDLVASLNALGSVILVRMPVSPDVREKEDAIFPDFDEKLKGLAARADVPYLDFSEQSSDFTFFDAHHLNVEGSRVFTRVLAKAIKDVREI